MSANRPHHALERGYLFKFLSGFVWTVSIKKDNAVQRMYDLAFEFSVYLDILQVDKRNVFINLLCLYLAMYHSVCVSNALQIKSMSIVKVDHKHT